MRKFIVSDLHGNGEVYDSIMAYLDCLSKSDEVELTINGDLIDYGFDSYRIIMDVIDRIKGKGKVKVHYLGGNHELMMHQALKKREPNKNVDFWSDWSCQGGNLDFDIEMLGDSAEEVYDFLRDFTGSLDVIRVFEQKVLGKPILLVHGQAPMDVLSLSKMKVKNDNQEVFDALWNREDQYGVFGIVMGKNRIGNPNFFTIVGHYPAAYPEGNKKGFVYRQDGENSFLNIDGGCHPYAVGLLEWDHVPLVEIKDGYLDILVFNHDNEIIDGYHFCGESIPMKKDELDLNRLCLNPKLNGNGEKNKELILQFKKDGIL